MSKGSRFKRLPGFRDFPPEEFQARARVFDAWRRVARRYGFEEYDGPPLESLDLYTEKSGDEIVGQLYNFVDKGGRDVAMRPEMTPSLARILGERSRAMPKPIRWFTIPQLFRYERQQRGRLREHFQWNVDIVGEADLGADVDVLAVAIDGLRELGLDSSDFHARVSDRRLLAALLQAVGVAEERLPAAYAVVDKLERAPREWAEERLAEDVGLEPSQVDALLALFDDPGLEAVRAAFGDRPEVADHLARLDQYLADLTALGLGEYVTFDLTIVRGLAYYTGIVFELFDRKGELRAICGGGRYDRLLELVGGDPLPAVGFGMGDVVLGELLKDRGLEGETKPGVDYFVAPVSPRERALALELAAQLRSRGHSVVYPLSPQTMRKQLKSAGTAGARYTVILGPDEVAEGMVVLRDMGDGSERRVNLQSLLDGE
jgi:histidyl-tRNA synthetase